MERSAPAQSPTGPPGDGKTGCYLCRLAFKHPVWFPIALLLSIGNVVAVWFAAREVPPEPLHATIHAVLGVAFGFWAHRLRLASRARASHQIGAETAAALDALEEAEAEATKLRQELSEAQERLDFAERMLERRPEPEPRRREPPGER